MEAVHNPDNPHPTPKHTEPTINPTLIFSG